MLFFLFFLLSLSLSLYLSLSHSLFSSFTLPHSVLAVDSFKQEFVFFLLLLWLLSFPFGKSVSCCSISSLACKVVALNRSSLRWVKILFWVFDLVWLCGRKGKIFVFFFFFGWCVCVVLLCVCVCVFFLVRSCGLEIWRKKFG